VIGTAKANFIEENSMLFSLPRALRLLRGQADSAWLVEQNNIQHFYGLYENMMARPAA
jgi:hypothetical protein